jgi:hypothetical protein
MQVRIRHVVWQDSGYHFRYVVPSDMPAYVGRRELKRSLHTTLPLEAQAAARRLAGMVDHTSSSPPFTRSHPSLSANHGKAPWHQLDLQYHRPSALTHFPPLLTCASPALRCLPDEFPPRGRAPGEGTRCGLHRTRGRGTPDH